MMATSKKRKISRKTMDFIEGTLFIVGLLLIACDSENVFSLQFILIKVLGFACWLPLIDFD
jgi:hypothetical protein